MHSIQNQYWKWLRAEKQCRGKAFFLTLSLVLTILFGCGRIAKDKTFSEGIVEYSISYIDNAPPKFDKNLRPDRMVIRFKDNNTINRIEALSGAFSFAFIQDLDNRTATTLIKIINKKLYYQEPIIDDHFHFAYEEMPALTFDIQSETELFLGYICNKAIATYTDSIQHSFEILFTKDIEITNPNFNTPYEPIDGIMMKFSVILFGQMMEITATSVKPTKLSIDEFRVPLEFERVNQETLREVIYLFQ